MAADFRFAFHGFMALASLPAESKGQTYRLFAFFVVFVLLGNSEGCFLFGLGEIFWTSGNYSLFIGIYLCDMLLG